MTKGTGSKIDSKRRAVLTGITAASAGLVTGTAEANTLHPIPSEGRANPRGRFHGKVVLITGATSGIGRTSTEAFAREGAKVMFCGRREKLGHEVEASIRKNGGEATYMRCDVRDAAQVKA